MDEHARGRVVYHEGIKSQVFQDERTLAVYLPPGYDEGEARCPVLYLHDGQNLFDPGRSAFGSTWRAGETADRLIAGGRIQPVLLVGIDNTPGRMDEYAPHRDRKHRAGGRWKEFARFVLGEVKPLVDGLYRTLPGRETTGIAGSSLGGLSALAFAFHHHDDFGMCAALSPSLWWAREQFLLEVEAADLSWARGVRLWLDMGTKEDRSREPVPAHVRRTRWLANLLDEAGLNPGRDYYYQEVAGGQHSEDHWASRFDKVLLFLFGG